MNLFKQLKPDLADKIMICNEGKAGGSMYDFKTAHRALTEKRFVTDLTIHELMCINRLTDYAFMNVKTCMAIFENFDNKLSNHE